MIDLHALRARMNTRDPLVLTAEEGRELLLELEVARKVIELPLDGTAVWPVTAQREMVSQLLCNLAAGISGEADAELTATLVVQELASLARIQVCRTRPMMMEGSN